MEFAAELQDFYEEDLKKWIPDIADRFHVTLVEALPNVSVTEVPENAQAAANFPFRYFPCSARP